MKKLLKVDVYSFNILLSIITPIILISFLSDRQNDLSKLSYSWLLTTDFLKFIVILLSYSLPLAFFSCKIYLLFKEANTSKFKQLVMIMSSLLFLPFGLALVLIIANINFVMVIALAVAIFIAYVNSYQLKPALTKA